MRDCCSVQTALPGEYDAEKKMFHHQASALDRGGRGIQKEYELPNDMNYAETCASIGLVFFARNMLKTEKNGRYADVMVMALW